MEIISKLPRDFERAVISSFNPGGVSRLEELAKSISYKALLERFSGIILCLLSDVEWQYDRSTSPMSIILRCKHELSEEQVGLFNLSLASFRGSFEITLTKADDEGDGKKRAEGLDVPPKFRFVSVNASLNQLKERNLCDIEEQIRFYRLTLHPKNTDVNGNEIINLDAEAFHDDESNPFYKWVANLRSLGYKVKFSVL